MFSRNLKDLLLAAPAGPRATMGLDPGIRTGVKVAVVDETGKLRGDATDLSARAASATGRARSPRWRRCACKHKVELISVGNGTGGRETDKLVAELMAKMPRARS